MFLEEFNFFSFYLSWECNCSKNSYFQIDYLQFHSCLHLHPQLIIFPSILLFLPIFQLQRFPQLFFQGFCLFEFFESQYFWFFMEEEFCHFQLFVKDFFNFFYLILIQQARFNFFEFDLFIIFLFWHLKQKLLYIQLFVIFLSSQRSLCFNLIFRQFQFSLHFFLQHLFFIKFVAEFFLNYQFYLFIFFKFEVILQKHSILNRYLLKSILLLQVELLFFKGEFWLVKPFSF